MQVPVLNSLLIFEFQITNQSVPRHIAPQGLHSCAPFLEQSCAGTSLLSLIIGDVHTVHQQSIIVVVIFKVKAKKYTAKTDGSC